MDFASLAGKWTEFRREFERLVTVEQSIVIRKRQENDEVFLMSVAFLIMDVQAHPRGRAELPFVL